MALYRSVSMSFWTDTKVVDEFSPEDKYFMLYCLTNTYTNLCGCYEISIKQMIRDTGYNEETIYKLIERLTNYGVIQYDKKNKELYIKNWFKYNWTKSEKLDKPLLNEIQNIKTETFKKILVDLYNERDTVSIPYTYASDTTVTDTVTVSNTVIYKDIINYLNNRIDSNYKYTSKKTQDLIKARLNENFTIDDFKTVIDKKAKDWLNTDMEKFLRPETLFSNKFEGYLNQKERKTTTKDLNIDISDF